MGALGPSKWPPNLPKFCYFFLFSDLSYIVLCENFVTDLKEGGIYESCIGYKKECEKLEADKDCYDETLLHSHVFKMNYGFEEGGGYCEDLCDYDFDDLFLYSNGWHDDIK